MTAAMNSISAALTLKEWAEKAKVKP